MTRLSDQTLPEVLAATAATLVIGAEVPEMQLVG